MLHLTYITISNESKNIAENMGIKYQLSFHDNKISESQKLVRLNPHETAKILLNTKAIHQNNSNIFEEKDIEDTTLIVSMVVKLWNLIHSHQLKIMKMSA